MSAVGASRPSDERVTRLRASRPIAKPLPSSPRRKPQPPERTQEPSGEVGPRRRAGSRDHHRSRIAQRAARQGDDRIVVGRARTPGKAFRDGLHRPVDVGRSPDPGGAHDQCVEGRRPSSPPAFAASARHSCTARIRPSGPTSCTLPGPARPRPTNSKRSPSCRSNQSFVCVPPASMPAYHMGLGSSFQSCRFITRNERVISKPALR